MSAKTRLYPQEQLRIFTESFKDNAKIVDICLDEELWPMDTAGSKNGTFFDVNLKYVIP